GWSTFWQIIKTPLLSYRTTGISWTLSVHISPILTLGKSLITAETIPSGMNLPNWLPVSEHNKTKRQRRKNRSWKLLFDDLAQMLPNQSKQLPERKCLINSI